MSLSPAQLGSKRFMYLQEHIRFLEHVCTSTYARTHTLSDTKTDIEHDAMWSVLSVHNNQHMYTQVS